MPAPTHITGDEDMAMQPGKVVTTVSYGPDKEHTTFDILQFRYLRCSFM